MDKIMGKIKKKFEIQMNYAPWGKDIMSTTLIWHFTKKQQQNSYMVKGNLGIGGGCSSLDILGTWVQE